MADRAEATQVEPHCELAQELIAFRRARRAELGITLSSDESEFEVPPKIEEDEVCFGQDDWASASEDLLSDAEEVLAKDPSYAGALGQRTLLTNNDVLGNSNELQPSHATTIPPFNDGSPDSETPLNRTSPLKNQPDGARTASGGSADVEEEESEESDGRTD